MSKLEVATAERPLMPEEIVGLLADDVRRQVVAVLALATGPVALPDLMADVNAPGRDVTEAAERLVRSRLVVRDGDAYRLDNEAFQASVRAAAALLPAGLNDEHTRIFRRYFFRGRLLQIPTEDWALPVVLDLIAHDFEPGIEYSEREVNTTLYAWNGDWATLRRLLVDGAYLRREAGVYQRA